MDELNTRLLNARAAGRRLKLDNGLNVRIRKRTDTDKARRKPCYLVDSHESDEMCNRESELQPHLLVGLTAPYAYWH